MARLNRRLTSSQIILLGFASVILVGTLLLMLPVSVRNGEGTHLVDALFTATSATCVTGLVVQDTATYWSGFGQAVILAMIQIGGMGIVTIAVAVSVASGKKISLRQRSVMQESISVHQVGGIVRLTGFIIKAAALIEGVGTAILLPVFWKEFGFAKGLWYSVFHAVSAFCNAGFDLMGVRSPYCSLTYYSSSSAVSITVMVLLVIGGIGFLTWEDVVVHRFRITKYRMQSKVILLTTGLLILIPAVYFYIFEFSGLPLKERILVSLFQSVTPRTAGFNTADITELSETGKAFMICLMLVGGSPGSTAGGFKTTTFAVILFTAVSVFRRKEDTSIFGRRIDNETVREAVTVLLLYLSVFFLGGCAIASIEGLPLLTALFETASAVATVGLTIGSTQSFCTVSRLILILLMYIGRVGGMTLVFAAAAPHYGTISTLPQEKITVG